ADVVEFARARRSHRGGTRPGSHPVGGFLPGARGQLLRVMDAGGHLGGGDPAEGEQGHTDAGGSGPGTPAHLVAADDEVHAPGLVDPTVAALAQDRTRSVASCRVRAVSCFESWMPAGTSAAVTRRRSNRATPTLTGPARAPRPTSSTPMTKSKPSLSSPCSTLRSVSPRTPISSR